MNTHCSGLFWRFVLVSVFAASCVMRAQSPGATFRPSLIESYAASYSYSGKSGYKHGTTDGETSVQRVDASIAGRSSLGKMTFLSYGLAVAVNEIDSDASVPVPGQLGEISVNIGAMKVFSPQWRGSVFVRPGYYGDMEHYTARALNVPAIALVTYSPNAKFMWLFGLSANPFSEYVVMPVVSLRWAFAEGWVFNAGFPRFGVTWQATKAVEVGAHLTMQGGGYRTTQAPGDAVTASATNTARLANTYVNYREIRTGVRATWKITAKTSLAIEGGWMIDRRFDYYDRDYELKGKPSAYATIALDARM